MVLYQDDTNSFPIFVKIFVRLLCTEILDVYELILYSIKINGKKVNIK